MMAARQRGRQAALGACMLAVVSTIVIPSGQAYAPSVKDALKGHAHMQTASARNIRTLAEAKEPQRKSQDSFLQSIGIREAWKNLQVDVTGIIAIVDTGADLKNPSLTPYLTDGINLLDGGRPPQDDNGHGTAVAGIIAAVADIAKTPGTPAEWRMKIMPVKALNKDGEGDEQHLAAGIRYAVDHGANIVVLSLGLMRDVPEMRDAVALAERKGVLLVAASGNDAVLNGSRATVQYPAAYPSVLAVAGAEGKGAEPHSTGGPEVDLAAVWRVNALSLGGGSELVDGTSMAAPQVAAAAALARAAHAGLSPSQLRELLRRTAEDIGAKGWDSATGFGLVRADLAVAASDKADWREPNGTRGTASPFPPGTEVGAAWSGSSDTDWYVMQTTRDGRLTVAVETEASLIGATPPSMLLYADNASQAIPKAKTEADGSAATWNLPRGRYYLRVDGSAKSGSLPYELVSTFSMQPDAMEPNDSVLSAFKLNARTQTWTGTFDHKGDQDWSVVTLPRDGKLVLTVETDTTRIDPAVSLWKAGTVRTETDAYAEGSRETVTLTVATAGKYYIKIRNATAAQALPVIGTYTAHLEYSTPKVDPGEPNNGPAEATVLHLKEGAAVFNGLIDSPKDADWYRVEVTGSPRLEMTLTGLPRGTTGKLTLLNKQLKVMGSWSGVSGKQKIGTSRKWQPGTYYIKVEANQASKQEFYQLRLHKDE